MICLIMKETGHNLRAKVSILTDARQANFNKLKQHEVFLRVVVKVKEF